MEATGSELAVQDVLDAAAYAEAHAPVDPGRVDLVGVSGGGHMALLVAGRMPDRVQSAQSRPGCRSAIWLPGTPSAAASANRPYADDLERSCGSTTSGGMPSGGAPGDSPAVDEQYRARSPITYLHPGLNTPLDINAGILDGHTGSVPISHTLRAFNAAGVPQDRYRRCGDQSLCRTGCRAAWTSRASGSTRFMATGASSAVRSNNARVTIFDGGHEIIYEAGVELADGTRET